MTQGDVRSGLSGRSSDRDVLQVSRRRVADLIAHPWGWRDTAVSLDGGRACFRTAAVASGIAATRSDCVLDRDFRSAVEHSGDVAILAFGLGGSSTFAFAGSQSRHLVRGGDVWLFRVADLTVLRRTPAQALASMVALKIDASRITAVLDDVRPQWSRTGTHAVRLAQGIDTRGGLGGLLDNPLASPLDRLRAESTALGLVADWLAPVPPLPEICGETLAPEDRRAVARVADALTADLCATPGLDDLAALAGMSHARLNRCFRKAYGQSVFAWLREYRLDAASRLLRRDAGTITDIAFRCGFSSSSHLATAFRQRFGCSPAAYRTDD